MAVKYLELSIFHPVYITFALAGRSIAPSKAGRKVRATKGTMLPNGKSGESLKQHNRK